MEPAPDTDAMPPEYPLYRWDGDEDVRMEHRRWRLLQFLPEWFKRKHPHRPMHKS